MKNKLRKGFTIVELVIVIAVIAVLTAVLVPTFVHLSKKAKAVSDQSLVANLNTALKMEYGEKGKAPKTMHDAVEGLYNQGYVLDNLVTKSEQDLVYSLAENKFYLSGEVTPGSNYWHIYKWEQIPSTQTWSIYASGSWHDMTDANALKVGFDAGDTDGKYNLAFNNSAEGVKAVIRTNSADTNLSVYAPNGSVEHHGDVGSLNILAVKDGSYHEFGNAAFAEISKGRIVLESQSEIKHIHVNKKTASSFDEVIIQNSGAKELPSAITRDQVTVSDETLVVKVVSSEGTENVYVYANGTSGSTVQITEGENRQNENVNSALGKLVLDNGESAGQKALDTDAKEKAQIEAVDELAGEEVNKSENISSYVARIGTAGYSSFAEAYEAAKAGDTVVLLKNVALGNIIEGSFVQEEWTTCFNFDKAGITLDLNGQTLVSTAYDDRLIAFYVKQNADLTIKDRVGTGMIFAPNAETVISVFGTLNVYGGTIKADYISAPVYDPDYGTYTVGSSAVRTERWAATSCGTANIYGGKIIASTGATYNNYGLNNCGVANIYGGSFESADYKNAACGIGNCGVLNIKESLNLFSYYWINNGLTATSVNVDEGKAFVADYIMIGKYKTAYGGKTMSATGDATYKTNDFAEGDTFTHAISSGVDYDYMFYFVNFAEE